MRPTRHRIPETPRIVSTSARTRRPYSCCSNAWARDDREAIAMSMNRTDEASFSDAGASLDDSHAEMMLVHTI